MERENDLAYNHQKLMQDRLFGKQPQSINHPENNVGDTYLGDVTIEAPPPSPPPAPVAKQESSLAKLVAPALIASGLMGGLGAGGYMIADALKTDPVEDTDTAFVLEPFKSEPTAR